MKYTGRRWTAGTYVTGGDSEVLDTFHDVQKGALPAPWTGETFLEVADQVNEVDRRPRLKGDTWTQETTSL